VTTDPTERLIDALTAIAVALAALAQSHQMLAHVEASRHYGPLNRWPDPQRHHVQDDLPR
jgi:UDP-N-acetylglucosamine 2-epimerase